RSLAGVIPEYLASPPTALPRRSGNYYFHLDPSGDAWSALKEGRNIAVYMDNPPADIEFELMVISGK
ncbi:MAG: type VI secretion system baseplate subunit TssK, partial [Gammaproteobacteria bacterium]|nr:type VI secretion system baseplate subunit TssK [Gammaproteobacteria bacterium]